MTSILFPSNTVYGTVINQGAICALSIGIATVSGITQSILRQLQHQHADRITQLTGLTHQRVSEIRRILRPAILICNVAFLFNEEKTPFSQFARKHFFWIAIESVLILTHIEPFYSSIEFFCNKISIPTFLSKTSQKIVALTTPLLKLARDNNPWLHALGTALLEEFIFRGILQEGFLRQLPKLVLRVTKLASPEFVDSPINKVIRNGISSLIFGLGHLHYKGVSHLISATLQGVSWGYIHENIGFFPAILAHFDNNFYVNSAR